MEWSIKSKYDKDDKVVFYIPEFIRPLVHCDEDHHDIVSYGTISYVGVVNCDGQYSFEYHVDISINEFERLANHNVDNQEKLLNKYKNGFKVIVPGDHALEVTIKCIDESDIIFKIDKETN